MKRGLIGLALALGVMLGMPSSDAEAMGSTRFAKGAKTHRSHAPELDPSLGGGAILLLLGGTAYLISRRRDED